MSMVEWTELGSLGRFENIGTDKKIIDGEQLVTLLNYVDVYHNKHIDASVPQMVVSASDKKIINCTVEQGDIFVTPSSETVDDIGHSAVIEETIPNAVYSYHIMRFRLFEKNMLLSYYINYAFDTENVKKQILKKAQGLTRFGLSKGKFSSIQIPIPSPTEQQRIVNILDTFTSSIDNLKHQVEQRRKQYEYYRENLLNLEGKEGVEMKTIGMIAKRNKGIPITAAQMSDLNTPGGNIRVFAAGQTKADIEESLLPLNCAHRKPSVIVKSRGFVDFEYYDKPFTHKNEMWSYSSEDKVLIKYIYFFLSTKVDFFRKKAKANSVKLPQLCVGDTDDYYIPIPGLLEQQNIVSILDTFEDSIRNLEEQLKLREKQYEYYRGKLLTFD